jgi:hypothetical protein
MNAFLRPAVIALAIAAPLGLALAQKNKTDGRYTQPNLVAAERLCAQAFVKLEAAEKSSESDGDHVAKAKYLLEQAQKEIKLATKPARKK